MKTAAGRILLAGASLCLGACGGLSDVGKQDDAAAAPVADVVVLNQPFSKDASGNATTRVRAGSEVFLSGKDSDGVVAPVLDFDWELMTQGAIADQIQLITRNASTRSFTAPTVTQDTPLQFRLTVTDSNGKTDRRNVDVTVVAIPDGGHFLSYNLDDQRQIKLVAIASRDVAPAELQSDVDFQVTVRRLVDYTTPGVDGPYLEVGTQVLTGKWLAGYGAGANCADVQNPSFHIPLPALDIDDILAQIDVSNPALVPNPALVDDFNVKLQISIEQGAGAALPADVSLDVCAERLAPSTSPAVLAEKFVRSKSRDGQIHFAQTQPQTGVLELTLDEVLGTADATADTKASAEAYYATIDPSNERTTFVDWLVFNGFLASSSEPLLWNTLAANAHAHGVYTNNFDLGFGRDMYARIVSCDGATPQLGQPIAQASIGTCDIAAVVVNYASLEAATKKVNPVLAVAMEYSKPRNSDRRIVQFYTFAPDSVTGSFQRVLSANLDGRGEKYMPQICTSCHGGTPGGVTAQGLYHNAADGNANGDVSATFLPWDIDSFLFSDSEGDNADRSYSDQSLRPLYTREAQTEAMRRLNQLAYLTYSDPLRPSRFTLPKQLLEGWYGAEGAAAFTSTNFNGDFVPQGWRPEGLDGQPGGGDDNPADAPAIYLDVFARNCRACHIAHLPAAEAGGVHLQTFTAGGSTFDTCDEQLAPAAGGQSGEPQRIGVAHQVPMACYRQFLNAPALAQRLASGAMPFARLTMDRLWVEGDSSAPAGALLRTHLGANLAGGAPEQPGTPFARISVSPQSADVGDWVSLVLTSDSRFIDAPNWSVCNQAGATCDAVPVVAPNSTEARFQVPAPGSFLAQLQYGSDGSGGSDGSVQQTLDVPDAAPSVAALPAEVSIGQPLTLSGSLVIAGNGPLEDHLWWVSDLDNFVFAGGTACTAPSPCRLGDVPQLQLVTTLTSIDAGNAAANRGVFTLHVRDADISEVTVIQDVEITGTLTIASLTGRVAANAVDVVVIDDATSVQLDLRQGNTAAGTETLAIEVENCATATNCATTGQNVRGLVGSARVAGVGLRYTPPATHATHPPTGTTRANPADSLRYRLVRRDGATVIEQSDWATVSIRVRAPVSFEQHVVAGIMKRTTGTWPSGGSFCETCHKPGGGYAAFFTDPIHLRYDWTADEIYQRLQPDATGRSELSKALPSVRYVDLSTSDPIANSALYLYPSTTSHSGNDRNPAVCPGTSPCDDLANIKLWIESGANRF